MTRYFISGMFLGVGQKIPVEIDFRISNSEGFCKVKILGGNFELQELQMEGAGVPKSMTLHKFLVEKLLIQGTLLPVLEGDQVRLFSTELEADPPTIVEGGE